MSSSNVDIQARFVNALRTQAKTADVPSSDTLPCPYCTHQGRIFQNLDQLWNHANDEHFSVLQTMDPSRARAQVKNEALKLKAAADQSSEATAGGGSTIGIGKLSLLESGKGRQSPSGRKRPAETSAEFQARKGKVHGPGEPQIYDPDFSRDIPFTFVGTPGGTPAKPTEQRRLFDPRQRSKGTASPFGRLTPEPSSEWSVEANRSQNQSSQQPPQPSPHGQYRPAQSQSAGQYPTHQRQPGLLEIQRYDPRYPELLLQPDSRPISQEQLAQEVKSIYAGLTMVETKCIHVDRAQALEAQSQETGPESKKFAPDHWQALIALHRTLLHEHHDFFLASQHPSASPALRRLAGKYSMPARMWKHGIHSFLELLRRRLPESIDYMLAFIYLAYQMMALLYETVPAFEETWIECLGDLGRYRMAIEDEDVRDRETWAGVARSWYSKAADRNPTVGRLYHHLAILARPNALQQLYYYARSLTCVRPFASARESILTLLDPVLGRSAASYSHALPIDTSFILAHAILFEKLPLESFDSAPFLSQLDNHIGRVTAKWKEQGVYIGVTNIGALFDYGLEESPLRQILLVHTEQKNQSEGRASSPSSEEDLCQGTSVDNHPVLPLITEDQVPSKIAALKSDQRFQKAYQLVMDTFSIALKRVGDKNVLPHVHVMLSFLFSFASIPHVAYLVEDAPWSDIVAFLNTLCKAEGRPDQIIPGPLFAEGKDKADSLPLPEDYLIRGQLWSQWYFPESWFSREHDEEDRYLELASTIKLRTERIMHLGYHISTLDRWLSYDLSTHTFSVRP